MPSWMPYCLDRIEAKVERWPSADEIWEKQRVGRRPSFLSFLRTRVYQVRLSQMPRGIAIAVMVFCSSARLAKQYRAFSRGASRSFSMSSPHARLTTQLPDSEVSSLRVNQDRLMKTLHYTCQWGTGVRWGP